MDNQVTVIEVTPDNVEKYGFCTFYKNPHTESYQRKLKWFTKTYKQGLKYRVIYSEKDEATMGIIEYVPGEYSWRSIDAKAYMVIHCIMVPKKHSGKGYGSLLINECVKDAQELGMNGVVALATQKPWCANEKIYLKNGFHIIDRTMFGFMLVAKQLRDTEMPSFGDLAGKSRKFNSGVYMLYSDQCPFMAGGEKYYYNKDFLKREHGIDAAVIELTDCTAAQMNPCVWGTYGMIANGNVINYVTGGRAYIKSLEKLGIIEKQSQR